VRGTRKRSLAVAVTERTKLHIEREKKRYIILLRVEGGVEPATREKGPSLSSSGRDGSLLSQMEGITRADGRRKRILSRLELHGEKSHMARKGNGSG